MIYLSPLFDVSMVVTDIESIISEKIRKSVHFGIPITEGYTSTKEPMIVKTSIIGLITCFF